MTVTAVMRGTGLPPGTTRLVVAVPTLQRLDLLDRALSGVRASQDTLAAAGRAIASEVVVVDNDPAGGAAVVASRHGARHVVEAQPGLAAVRNRAIDEALGARLLVFLDDDEVPDPDWLVALTDVWQSHGAQAVAGKVVTELAESADPWVVAYYERPRRTGGQLLPAAATNNLLLDLDFVRSQGLRFDARFGLTGGEDSRFTLDLAAAGGQIRWAEHARVTEGATGERVTRRWLLRRSMRMGLVDARLAFATRRGRPRPAAARLSVVSGGAARMLAGSAQWLTGLVTRDVGRQVRGARTTLRGIGRLSAVVRMRDDEYARRHSA